GKSGRVMSPGTATTCAPMARAVSAAASAGSGSRSLSTIRAPSRASCSTRARPMPRPAPVTMATLPLSLLRIETSPLAGYGRSKCEDMRRSQRPDIGGPTVLSSKRNACRKGQALADTRTHRVDIGNPARDCLHELVDGRSLGLFVDDVIVPLPGDDGETVADDECEPDVAVGIESEPIGIRSVAQVRGSNDFLATQAAIGADCETNKVPPQGFDSIQVTPIGAHFHFVGLMQTVRDDTRAFVIQQDDIAARFLVHRDTPGQRVAHHRNPGPISVSPRAVDCTQGPAVQRVEQHGSFAIRSNQVHLPVT